MVDYFEDLRVFIGVFFLLLGGALIIHGQGPEPLRADQLNLNLDCGIAFVIFAVGALLWAAISHKNMNAAARENL